MRCMYYFRDDRTSRWRRAPFEPFSKAGVVQRAWLGLQRTQPIACRSLREACCKTIIDSIDVEGVLGILRLVRELKHASTVAAKIEQACLQFIHSTYSRVREAHGPNRVREAMGDDLWESLEVWEREVHLSRRLLHVKGNIVQPSVSYKEGDEAGKGIFPSNRLSVAGAGHRSYPYEWLLAGKEWPDDVDPSLRERFLEGPRFMSLFGMKYQEFSGLPRWRQLQLKQEVLLF